MKWTLSWIEPLLACLILTTCTTVIKRDHIVRGEIIEIRSGHNMRAEEPERQVYRVTVGYRLPSGVYEQRPFIVSRQEYSRLGLANASEACVDISNEWHVLTPCPD